MNKFFYLGFIVFIMSHFTYAQSYFTNEFPAVWHRATSYTKAVAEAMPNSLYDYKPNENSMSFQEQQLHIVSNISFLTYLIVGEKTEFYEKNDTDRLDKEQVLSIMDKAFAHVSELIKVIEASTLQQIIHFREENMSKENLFYLIRNHMTHHRAQSIMYLRMHNVEVPKYVGW